MARTMSSSRTSMVIAMILAGLLLASAKYNAGQRVQCRTSDITVTQRSTGALQNGIPIYKVNITNAGTAAIANIHVNCGSFRSATLVDPNIFRRLDHNDCIVNGGKPLAVGSTINFQYASSFKQPFYVSHVSCSTW